MRTQAFIELEHGDAGDVIGFPSKGDPDGWVVRIGQVTLQGKRGEWGDLYSELGANLPFSIVASKPDPGDLVELPADTLRLVLHLAWLTEHRDEDEQAALLTVAEFVDPTLIPDIRGNWTRDEVPT